MKAEYLTPLPDFQGNNRTCPDLVREKSFSNDGGCWAWPHSASRAAPTPAHGRQQHRTLHLYCIHGGVTDATHAQGQGGWVGSAPFRRLAVAVWVRARIARVDRPKWGSLCLARASILCSSRPLETGLGRDWPGFIEWCGFSDVLTAMAIPYQSPSQHIRT